MMIKSTLLPGEWLHGLHLTAGTMRMKQIPMTPSNAAVAQGSNGKDKPVVKPSNSLGKKQKQMVVIASGSKRCEKS